MNPSEVTDPGVLLLAFMEAKAEGDEEAAAAIKELIDATPSAEPVKEIEPVKMADEISPTVGETALAGRDGAELARLISDAKRYGVETLWQLVRESLRGYRGTGPLLDQACVAKLSDSLAAVNATAELMGRTRVREMKDRALSSSGLSKFKDDHPWSTFADSPPGVIDTPQAALDYFSGLVPKLGVDPERFAGEQRRRAFQLAASTNEVLTRQVQDVIRQGLRESKSVADTTARITEALEKSGVTPRHAQYAEMVYRTNANDAFQTGLYEEGRDPDVRDVFPVYEYLIVNDSRVGDDHKPKGGRIYSSEVSFSDARGKRPFNCRCSMKWIDFMDWEEMERAGKRIYRY